MLSHRALGQCRDDAAHRALMLRIARATMLRIAPERAATTLRVALDRSLA
ncbi:hypothetical protein LB515_10515 [Mesorhizobium sp. CA15]|nr:hypothetical protein [Mesorhizobium sp. CA15]MBZ9865810.1 hypothetical protein [Mesorhizobium sp. CA15]